MNAIALQRTVADLVAEYDEKARTLPDEIASFEAATRAMLAATGIGGVYGGDIWGYSRTPSVDDRAARKALLVSGWKAIYSRLQIDRLATAKDRALWERTVADPPPLTIDNAIATFGDYLLRARFHLLRGLAETFVDLDPAYKSHSKVKIGVAGLPKRIIVRSVGSYGSHGRDKIRDVVNALAAYRGDPLFDHIEFRELDALHSVFGHTAGEVALEARVVKTIRNGREEEVSLPRRGIRIRKFWNGNAHVIFEPDTLREINRALAEFYGDVLPDAEGEEPAPRRPSTAVARDLQFYPTPAAVIDTVLYEVGIEKRDAYNRDRYPAKRILEPSCGDGRIMDAIRERGHRTIGIEVDPGRAATARAKGHAVITANFLETPPVPDFDLVVMNPPFYGRHYLHHVRHALRFLKPGGTLVAILPASAHYDHGELPPGRWFDLPVASFAESGTNVPTGFLIVKVPS